MSGVFPCVFVCVHVQIFNMCCSKMLTEIGSNLKVGMAGTDGAHAK